MPNIISKLTMPNPKQENQGQTHFVQLIKLITDFCQQRTKVMGANPNPNTATKNIEDKVQPHYLNNNNALLPSKINHPKPEPLLTTPRPNVEETETNLPTPK